MPPFLYHNADGAGCQGRRIRAACSLYTEFGMVSPLPVPCKRSSDAPIPFGFRLSAARSHRTALPVVHRDVDARSIHIKSSGYNFHNGFLLIDVKKPPRSKEWSCSISFDGKSAAEFNADMCLFLEQWQQEREDVQSFASTLEAYKKWKDTTLAYYAANTVETVEPQELDPDERIRKRNEFLENAYKKTE